MAGSQWAWLCDMELDDTVLGLGAAGIFPTAPLALGFLVNAAHCASKGTDGAAMHASDMYREKRDFLDVFFAGGFLAILDRYGSAGKARGWAGELGDDELASGLGKACGLEDELVEWCDRVTKEKPSVLHLLLSGPLLGRGREICAALGDRVLDQPEAKVVIWTYAGSFNLLHSSPDDKDSLKQLVDAFSPRVKVVETTLKAGSWLCSPPKPFWGDACPTAWTLEEAKSNPIGFNMSTDIQSLNMFLEEYCTQSPTQEKRGLRWIFGRIAEERQESTEAPAGQAHLSVTQLLDQLEDRSLATNLTKMVPPSSSSMSKVREALSESARRHLDGAFQKAKGLLESGTSLSRTELVKAAAEYAELYRGEHGDFEDAGCSHCFPPGQPFGGPRLDKRCILRCMAHGKLQGGATADLLVVLALLVHLAELDPSAAVVAPSPPEVSEASGSRSLATTCCSPLQLLWHCGNAGGKGSPFCQRLPPSTRALFQLEPSCEGNSKDSVLAAQLAPGTEMSDATRAALAPLVDAAAAAIVFGAARIRGAALSGAVPPWGSLRQRS